MTDPQPIVDPQHFVHLDDGTHAAVAIGYDGTRELWLLGADSNADCGCACPDHAPHEQTGPLPEDFRHRVAHVLLRCGAPTLSTGRPCRTPVARQGDRCAHHRQPLQEAQ